MSSSNPSMVELYRAVTDQVVDVLRQWSQRWAGHPKWASVLNKATLQHEVEESIVVLHHLQEWMTKSQKSLHLNEITVVDACCGKGLFSMILSFLQAGPWRQHKCVIKQIVLFDRAMINYHHIYMANQSADQEHRPKLLLWQHTDLHAYDELLDRLLALNSPLALVGIHLCKGLGPSVVSLVNGLGNKVCPFFCFAPCCLPRRAISKYVERENRVIPITQYEDTRAREIRRKAQQMLRVTRGKVGMCYLCWSREHRVRDCPDLQGKSEPEIAAMLKEAGRKIPCWKCGQVGHFKADCLNKAASKVDPPTIMMDVSAVLPSNDPFGTYCQIISTTIQQPQTIELHHTGLLSDAKHANTRKENWNCERKSIYIVASR